MHPAQRCGVAHLGENVLHIALAALGEHGDHLDPGGLPLRDGGGKGQVVGGAHAVVEAHVAPLLRLQRPRLDEGADGGDAWQEGGEGRSQASQSGRGQALLGDMPQRWPGNATLRDKLRPLRPAGGGGGAAPCSAGASPEPVAKMRTVGNWAGGMASTGKPLPMGALTSTSAPARHRGASSCGHPGIRGRGRGWAQPALHGAGHQHTSCPTTAPRLTRPRRTQLLRGAALVLDQQLHHPVLLVGARRRGDGKEAGLALLAKLGLQARWRGGFQQQGVQRGVGTTHVKDARTQEAAPAPG
jgi:hypothetical protein